MKWYEVLRHDGTKHYATKSNDLYFLDGSGFGYKKFDAVSVTPIDGEPPSELVECRIYIDGVDETFRGIVNANQRWNGWEMPWIHISDVERLCTLMSDNECYKWTYDGEKVTLLDIQENYTSIAEPTTIGGETYYYFGNEGLCFQREDN